jgi:hypothetical protein
MALFVNESTFAKDHPLCTYQGTLLYIWVTGPKDHCISPLSMDVYNWFFSKKNFIANLDYDDDCIVDSEYQLFWNTTYKEYVWKPIQIIAEMNTDRIFLLNRSEIKRITLPVCESNFWVSVNWFLFLVVVLIIVIIYFCRFQK